MLSSRIFEAQSRRQADPAAYEHDQGAPAVLFSAYQTCLGQSCRSMCKPHNERAECISLVGPLTAVAVTGEEATAAKKKVVYSKKKSGPKKPSADAEAEAAREAELAAAEEAARKQAEEQRRVEAEQVCSKTKSVLNRKEQTGYGRTALACGTASPSRRSEVCCSV